MLKNILRLILEPTHDDEKDQKIAECEKKIEDLQQKLLQSNEVLRVMSGQVLRIVEELSHQRESLNDVISFINEGDVASQDLPDFTKSHNGGKLN